MSYFIIGGTNVLFYYKWDKRQVGQTSGGTNVGETNVGGTYVGGTKVAPPNLITKEQKTYQT